MASVRDVDHGYTARMTWAKRLAASGYVKVGILSASEGIQEKRREKSTEAHTQAKSAMEKLHAQAFKAMRGVGSEDQHKALAVKAAKIHLRLKTALKTINAVSVIDVANWAEFGIGTKARPFVRGYVDKHKADITTFVKKQTEKAFLEGHPPEWILERVGLFVQTGIQKFIADRGDGTYAGNQPRTVKAKGSDTPLIDTGVLRSSVTYAVGNDK